MEYTEKTPPGKGAIDPYNQAGPLSTWRHVNGWACLDVRKLRSSGCSLNAIGLAAAMLSREETSSTEERLRTVYSLDRFQANKLLRELVVAGFLEVRSGLYHVDEAARPR